VIPKLIYNFKQSLINNLIRVVEQFLSKDYSQWIICLDGGGGNTFSRNAWSLLTHLTKHQQEIRTICITKSEYYSRKAKESGIYCIKPNTIAALCKILKGGVCICSHEMAEDMVNFSCKNTIKINLWHGVPLKKIQYASDKIQNIRANLSLKQRLKELIHGYVPHESYDGIIYTSPAFQNIYAESFNNTNLLLTGHPRDDIFYEVLDREKILNKLFIKKTNGKRIITYLPTFRDKRKTDKKYVIFQNNPELIVYLKNHDVVIVQKNHGTDNVSIEYINNVYLLPKQIDTQELLYITDLLITDYSSCYIDFLHTLRPIVFYPYDLEEYKAHDRELFFDYYDPIITPGDKVNNEVTLAETVLRYLKEPELGLEKRKRSLDFFHTYQDGKASQRVYKAINMILENKMQKRNVYV